MEGFLVELWERGRESETYRESEERISNREERKERDCLEGTKFNAGYGLSKQPWFYFLVRVLAHNISTHILNDVHDERK